MFAFKPGIYRKKMSPPHTMCINYLSNQNIHIFSYSHSIILAATDTVGMQWSMCCPDNVPSAWSQRTDNGPRWTNKYFMVWEGIISGSTTLNRFTFTLLTFCCIVTTSLELLCACTVQCCNIINLWVLTSKSML